jgi:AraC family transcriptional regulator of adaptative response / DNA-3-methyladenine glycosylase II
MTAIPQERLHLAYRPPFDWPAALGFLSRRAIDGVERVHGACYRRTIRLGRLTGTLDVAHDPATAALVVTVAGPVARAADIVARRVRRLFDLDADVAAIGAHLALDPLMAPLVVERPAVRVFGGWDGFEVAVRSVIGQQVSVGRARQLNGLLADRRGTGLAGALDGLSRVFPTPAQVLDGDLPNLGMPRARVATLQRVARAVLDDPRLFERSSTLDETLARLRAVPGIGDWTAHYIAMRACGEPDAFPAGDAGLLRGASDAAGVRPAPRTLVERAEPWRPWRAYAAHHLWALDSARGA